MAKLTITFPVVCCLFLASCGGTNVEPAPPASKIPTRIDEATSLHSNFLDEMGTPLFTNHIATSAEILNSSNATFSGSLLTEANGNKIVGDLEIALDFDDLGSSVTVARNFQNQLNHTYSGELTGIGSINPLNTSSQLTATLSGSLISVDDDSASVSFALDGVFLQAGGNQVGAVAGTVDGLFDSSLVMGTFVAER